MVVGVNPRVLGITLCTTYVAHNVLLKTRTTIYEIVVLSSTSSIHWVVTIALYPLSSIHWVVTIAPYPLSGSHNLGDTKE